MILYGSDSYDESCLISDWIMREFILLQKDYFQHLQNDKWEINLATEKLIKFTRLKLSQEYLELTKITASKTTSETLFFVYQQLLIMFHPVIPFLTDYLYDQITGEKILETELQPVDTKYQLKFSEELWHVDCCLLVIGAIRNLLQKQIIQRNSELGIEFTQGWTDKYNHRFDFNRYLKPLVNCRIIVGKDKNFTSFVSLVPFGYLWYSEESNRTKLQKMLEVCENEYSRSYNLLNSTFLSKAPSSLIQKEQKKLVYYQEQKAKIENELRKLDDFQ